MWQKLLMKRMIDKSFVRWSETRCLRNRNKHSQCSACVDICPQPALKIVDGQLSFKDDHCSNCKLCVHVCPTEAMYYEYEQLYKYEQKIQSYETVCFSCEEQGNGSTDVILPCISALTPEMLMIADLYGKEKQIFWNEKTCQTCKSNWSHERNLDWVDDWNKSDVFKSNVNIISHPEQKITNKRKLTRRELFSFTKDKSKEHVATLVFDSFDNFTNIKNKLSLTDRRKYLVAYLKRKNMSGKVPDKMAKKLGVVNINVTSNCQLCQKCSAVCPTGALKIVETEEMKALTFQAQHCIDCDICEHVCLEISKQSICFEEIQNKTVLQEQKLNKCPSCGDVKLENDTYCDECNVKQVRKNILLHNW
ncbi:hypothetical protein BKP35_11675 [Anaerobacillus arseniciselenatis]|uniref:4Fe-4S ferredoxin-type domain-containing protein n=1 Tax=Anaerobacillus arseniciselenatis TaxID=85682 RepID=A0A1S2LJE8_9BACI|nr:4Fe-4S dicluster domain-containing protein [Anaerobacillus arseniciselenatis]OIJ11595.1 hypothetical protein BKP35_11675 [Anaerobacillus arseniciselenatis]